MYRHSKALNQRARKNLASALIQCHFDYSASAWYMSVCTTLKNKLQIAQNKIIRFVLGMGPRDHIGQLELNRVGFLNTKDRVHQLMLNHMHNVFNNNAPDYMVENFTRVGDVHQHFTRNSLSNFVIPRVLSPAQITSLYKVLKYGTESQKT